MNRRALVAIVTASLALGACGGSKQPPLPPAPAQPTPATLDAGGSASANGDQSPKTDGDVTTAWLHGMEVIVKRTPGAEFVAAQLFVRGGVRNWTAQNAGIENVALSVATTGGTQSLAKGPYTLKLASLGATIDVAPGKDFSKLSAKAPADSWGALFPLFVETFLAPALPASEFDLVKQHEISSRRHELEDGNGRLNLLLDRVLFAGHPYANRAVGTIETLSDMKLADLAPYLGKLRDTNRLLLVVVGDLEPLQVIDQANAAFSGVPRGSYVETPIPPLHFDGSHVTGDPFQLPTNYIESAFAGPTWGDPDFPAMWLAMRLLGQREFDEVRSKRNLSYAPAAFFDRTIAAPFGALYVTAVDPNTTMKVMFDQARRLETEPVPQKDLDGTKAVFLSRYMKSHETVDGQASLLGEAQILGGDYKLANIITDRMKAVTAAQIADAMKKWFVNVQTCIVGDPPKLDAKIVVGP